MHHIRILLLLFLLKADDAAGQGNVFERKGTFSMSCDSIKRMAYDSNSTPLQIIARDIFGQKSHQSLYRIEHTDIETYYSNVTGLSVDTLRSYFPGDSLTKITSRLFLPLFTHKGDKELPQWRDTVIRFEYRLLLCKNLNEEAIMIIDDDEIYYLRRNRERLWRLYNWSIVSEK